MTSIDPILEKNREVESIATREGISFLKIIHWFFDYPLKEMSLNDLAATLGIAKTTARKSVFSLVKLGFLKQESLGKVWRIFCDQQHPYNVYLKVPYHLELLYLSGVVQEVVRKISGARSVILFGSYRKGDDTEKSDIDLAVEVVNSVPLKIQPLTKLKRLGYRKDVDVNLHVFSRKHIDLNLFTNIANGIVLYGLLEVKP